jgi:hypothetical protein
MDMEELATEAKGKTTQAKVKATEAKVPDKVPWCVVLHIPYHLVLFIGCVLVCVFSFDDSNTVAACSSAAASLAVGV